MEEFINYEEWVRVFTSNSKNAFGRESEKLADDFLNLCKRVPEKYSWGILTDDDFKKLTEKAKPEGIYWRDFARSVEVYDITFMWPARSIVPALIRSLNSKEIIVSAILSRSLLELAVSSLCYTNDIRITVKGLIEKKEINPNEEIIGGESINSFIREMLFGTRIKSMIPAFPEKESILKKIDRVSKSAELKEWYDRSGSIKIDQLYEYLCDITHPSMVGNAIFWGDVSETNGNKIRKLKQDNESELWQTTVDNILFAIGLSASSLNLSFLTGQESVLSIAKLWGVGNINNF